MPVGKSQMKFSLMEWIGKGADIAGAGIAPVFASSLGDPTGGVLAQLGVVLTKEIIDYAERVQSESEQRRSAAALLSAGQKIQNRLNAGEELRSDDFFRIRIGTSATAQTVLDGVLTKARSQYEERKALLMGHLLANASFDDGLSADDLCWMLSCIDSLTYRHLLILAHFCDQTPSGWTSNNIGQIHTRSPIVLTQIAELRSLGLLSGHSTFEVSIEIAATGRLLVQATDLQGELEIYGEEIIRTIASPQPYAVG